MKKKTLYFIVLITLLGCYRDNGEPLRIDSPPCEANLLKNTYTRSGSRENLSNAIGEFGGNYMSGFFVYANTNSDHYFNIEFKNKPVVRKNYYTTNPNYFNFSEDECIVFVTNRITNTVVFSEKLNTVYVDITTDGDLIVSFCDLNLKDNFNPQFMTIDDFTVIIPN